MARFKKHTPKVEEVRPYLHGVARLLADKLHGPDGPPWGTSLTDIEDLILELRAILSERLLAELLSRQAQAQPPVDAHTCPTCRQPLDTSPPDDNPRSLQTRAGQANWVEPEAYCNRCRRAFFPSVQEPGH